MPPAPNQQSDKLLWAESNQGENVPSDFTQSHRDASGSPEERQCEGTYLTLGTETREKNYQVRSMDMEEFWNRSAINMRGQLQSRGDVD